MLHKRNKVTSRLSCLIAPALITSTLALNGCLAVAAGVGYYAGREMSRPQRHIAPAPPAPTTPALRTYTRVSGNYKGREGIPGILALYDTHFEFRETNGDAWAVVPYNEIYSDFRDQAGRKVLGVQGEDGHVLGDDVLFVKTKTLGDFRFNLRTQKIDMKELDRFIENKRDSQ